ncbi:pre-mRNA processing factor 3-domain-containing protein, partial [Thamnocephalis sphaerospora]
KNPYFDPNIAVVGPKQRNKRNFNFVGQGTYTRQGEKLRAQAHLERLRKEIAASTQRAGMEVELDIAADKQIRVHPPPDVEWWDEPLLENRSYDDVAAGNIRLSGEDTLVTVYVQHPVPIPGPQDKAADVARPLLLTEKERKKLRRQRRLETLREKQDKIRLGLLPPEPPKVKLSNLMRVLGNEAIQDPTKMEAYVRSEVRKRQDKHMQMNEERKLTDDQRREKRRQKLDEDAAKGIHVLVFRINDLTHPQKKFKVETNANQLALTGVAIIHTRTSLVIVEGGPKSIKTYKKLMLRRIKWSDPDAEMLDADEEQDGGDMDVDAPGDERRPNRCVLAWEGQVAGRSFKGFRFRRCPTESAVKEALKHNRAAHYWDIAR